MSYPATFEAAINVSPEMIRAGARAISLALVDEISRPSQAAIGITAGILAEKVYRAMLAAAHSEDEGASKTVAAGAPKSPPPRLLSDSPLAGEYDLLAAAAHVSVVGDRVTITLDLGREPAEDWRTMLPSHLRYASSDHEDVAACKGRYLRDQEEERSARRKSIPRSANLETLQINRSALDSNVEARAADVLVDLRLRISQ